MLSLFLITFLTSTAFITSFRVLPSAAFPAQSRWTKLPRRHSTSPDGSVEPLVGQFMLEIMMNDRQTSKITAEQVLSMFTQAESSPGAVIERPTQPALIAQSPNVLSLEWLNYLRVMKSWLDYEITIAQWAIELRCSDALNKMTPILKAFENNQSTSFRMLYKQAADEINTSISASNYQQDNSISSSASKTDPSKVPATSNPPVRGPNGRFISRSSRLSASPTEDPQQYFQHRALDSTYFAYASANLSLIYTTSNEPTKNTRCSNNLDKWKGWGNEIKWNEMKESGSNIYEVRILS
jgi:hypothetical protein